MSRRSPEVRTKEASVFSTSFVAAVVTGLAASASVGTVPTMQSDYRVALTESAKLQKPVAVFIARGTEGYAKVVTDGGIGSDSAKLLQASYVCVYLDTATASGKELASAFNITEGLVISDKTGGIQNLRIEGTLAPSDLKSYLVKFADGAKVATTETHSAAAPATATFNPYRTYVYGGGGCATGNCPNRR